MKLRYYLRGLGIGIVVTAVAMAVSLGDGKEKLSDDEIRARARELGMVESTVLSALNHDTGSPDGEKSGQDGKFSGENEPEGGTAPGMEAQSGGDAGTLPEGGKTQSGGGAGTLPEDDKTQSGGGTGTLPEDGESQPGGTDARPEDGDLQPDNPLGGTVTAGQGEPSAQMVTVTIVRGDSSGSVSRMLEEAGLVKDAGEYDRYLCNNGYDKSICVGTFKIPVGSTEEEIAKVITKKLSFE